MFGVLVKVREKVDGRRTSRRMMDWDTGGRMNSSLRTCDLAFPASKADKANAGHTLPATYLNSSKERPPDILGMTQPYRSRTLSALGPVQASHDSLTAKLPAYAESLSAVEHVRLGSLTFRNLCLARHATLKI